MRKDIYPFSAIVEQHQMKLALLLAAVDWRISVLLRGDKGSAKTTAARALANLLPAPSPFVNLPIGATEDRLLGGLHLERTLKGDPSLKPGLLAEAHGGVLYIDEINLLSPYLGDTLLDVASSGINVVEREGLSASHEAEFVLLGSMNPEEGSLRPQLLDRFALAVDVTATLEPGLRQTVVERRIAFELNPVEFHTEWYAREEQQRERVRTARIRRSEFQVSQPILLKISEAICEAGVRSLRADLSVVRASIAYAALTDAKSVTEEHIAAVLPLVLFHRKTDRPRPRSPQRESSRPNEKDHGAPKSASTSEDHNDAGTLSVRIFPSTPIETPRECINNHPSERRGAISSSSSLQKGAAVGNRRTETPQELDLRATLNHAVIQTGNLLLNLSDLHERIRESKSKTRYLIVIDSSGSHALQQRMRLVKGFAIDLLTRCFKRGDEIVIIIFRGPSAQILLERCTTLDDAFVALEYLPTGGRTPLAHALDLAKGYIVPGSFLVLLTDGRANVALANGDPWLEALEIAGQIDTAGLVVDTERSSQPTGRPSQLANALKSHYVQLQVSDATSPLSAS
jgi:magnesium chelatase subunit D